MKKFFLAPVLLLWFTLPDFADQHKVLGVIDGDTIAINDNGKKNASGCSVPTIRSPFTQADQKTLR